LLTIDGYTWSSNNEEENDRELLNFPTVNNNDSIAIEYNPVKKELKFTINNYSCIITMVESSYNLVPCVVLKNIDDEVTIDW